MALSMLTYTWVQNLPLYHVFIYMGETIPNSTRFPTRVTSFSLSWFLVTSVEIGPWKGQSRQVEAGDSGECPSLLNHLSEYHLALSSVDIITVAYLASPNPSSHIAVKRTKVLQRKPLIWARTVVSQLIHRLVLEAGDPIIISITDMIGSGRLDTILLMNPLAR